MSKAILVIDMPNECTECPVHFLDLIGKDDFRLWCGKKCKNIELHDNGCIKTGYKPDWCPLKTLPKKEDVNLFNDRAGYALGWNACIDEISGVTK